MYIFSQTKNTLLNLLIGYEYIHQTIKISSGVNMPLSPVANSSDGALPQCKEAKPTLWFLFNKSLRKVRKNAIIIVVFIFR